MDPVLSESPPWFTARKAPSLKSRAADPLWRGSPDGAWPGHCFGRQMFPLSKRLQHAGGTTLDRRGTAPDPVDQRWASANWASCFSFSRI